MAFNIKLQTCTNCNEKKSLKEFEKDKRKKTGYRNQCNECRKKEKSKQWYVPLVRRMGVRHKENSHITRDEDVNSNFLKKLKEKQKGMCYWLNIPIDFEGNDKLRSPSIDRLDNSKGYTRDNIVLTTRFANLGRCSSDCEEMEDFIEKFIN